VICNEEDTDGRARVTTDEERVNSTYRAYNAVADSSLSSLFRDGQCSAHL